LNVDKFIENKRKLAAVIKYQQNMVNFSKIKLNLALLRKIQHFSAQISNLFGAIQLIQHNSAFSA